MGRAGRELEESWGRAGRELRKSKGRAGRVQGKSSEEQGKSWAIAGRLIEARKLELQKKIGVLLQNIYVAICFPS